MKQMLRTLLFALLTGIGLGAAAQGHLITVAGHMTPCNPAMAGSTVNIHVYGHASGPIAISTTLNENCYYVVDLLVPDTAGLVYVGGSCGNGTFSQDSLSYQLTPPFSTDVIIDLECGGQSACQACFTIDQTAAFTGTFNSCSTGGTGPFTYLWDFSGPGGGGVEGNNISHTFPGPGTYAACLNLTDANGITCQICESVVVDDLGVINPTPTECNACFTIEQASGGGMLTPFSATFTNCSTGNNPPYTYSWWLPDGGSSTATNEAFTFAEEGVYGVCLTVGDGNGCSSTLCDTVHVSVSGLISTLRFDCLEVPGGSAQIGWPCNDNDPMTSGDTWTANCTCEGTLTNPDPCEADFWVIQASDSIGGQAEPIPNELWIWNLSSGGTGNFQFLWSFGDGTSSSEPFPSHTYEANGPYTLCLTMTDDAGCSSTHCQDISIDDDGFIDGMILEGGVHTIQGPRSLGFTINVINPLTMAVPELADLTELNLWPNPTQDRLDVMFNSVKSGQVRTEVVDMNGRRVAGTMHQLVHGKNRIQLEVSDLPAGMYLLRIGEGAQNVVQRFVKAD